MSNVYKIAVVGGGANGVSVFNELINQLSVTDHPENFEVTLYEKSGVYGAGLAYGTHLDAHILNMPASTMSAVGGNPEHFLQWLKQPHDPALHPYFNAQAVAKDFVPRKIFGMYLEQMYQNAIKKAGAQGIKVRVLNEEAFDVTEQGQEVVIASTGKKETYNQAVLCIGNQQPTFGQELKGITGYFHHAWPEHALMKGIPTDEEVYIIGTSLTAIDAFITLLENGHTGPINMVSRHGILPKVRVLAEPYELSYLSPNNIRALTSNGTRTLSLDEVLQLFIQEFEEAGANISDMSDILSLPSKSALDVLKQDIEMAQHGNMKYFSVLKAIDEVVGDIWTSLSLEDREMFDAHYKAFWNAYDYPMPMQNAQKILAAMETGQLRVLSGFRKLKYDMTEKSFVVTCIGQDKTQPSTPYTTKYVVNATGQGLNINELEAPIIYNTLESGTITPHLLGGIDVDFDSGAIKGSKGKYSERIYAVGSLTRGVHFYTNSINENAKCGKRAVTALVGRAKQQIHLERQAEMITEQKKPQNIALFIGSDISSHLLMNDLVPQLIQEGFQPSIYFAKHRASKKPVLPEIQEQGFFERIMLADHIYPFLDEQPLQEGAPCHSPQQLAKIYGITVREIESVNDPDFIAELKEEGIDTGVVVRCYQKFGKDTIAFFNREPHNALWNLHPGVLPYYRGVMTYFRSMNDGQNEAGYSLHVIDEDWDAGPVMDVRPQPLDLSKPMLTNYCDIATSGVPIIVDNLKKLANGEAIPAIPQSDEEKGYHTFPKREEMDEFLAKGLSLADPEDMKAIYLAQFSVEGTEHHRQLSMIIDDAIAQRFDTKPEPPKPDDLTI